MLKVSLIVSSLLAFLSQVALGQQISGLDYGNPQQQILGNVTVPEPKRVAIIGAGSAGASTAYYLQQYAFNASIPINITVFERSSYIGGRSTTVHVHDDPSQPVELGASIFVSVNYNLVSAVEAFNLSLADDDPNGENTLGIWNGKEFVWIQPLGGSRWSSWWSRTKLIYRYGLAPLRTLRLMREIVGRFLKMYDEPHFPWYELSQVAYDVGLTAVTASTGEQYLKDNGIGDRFAKEVVQASTRVNYAQNLARLHGLEAMVCMAADGAMAVEGGNWRIFEGMLNASRAGVMLNTSVTGVRRLEDGSFAIATKHRTKDPIETVDEARSELDSEVYDTVVLAAPYQFASLDVSPVPATIPDAIDYVTLHVTLFTTGCTLSPLFFGLAENAPVPEAILTTLHPSDSSSAGVGQAGFFSISRVGTARNSKTGLSEDVYKIFSPEPVSDAFLGRLVGSDQVIADGQHGGDITWIYRKVWQSYPYLPPRITFEALELDRDMWYTSGIESFISTMETSSLMGKNVAKLIVNRWLE